MDVWYRGCDGWLETMAVVAHRWQAPSWDEWITVSGTTQDRWNAKARLQATIWTADPGAVMGLETLTSMQAARVLLDPIRAAQRVRVEPKLTPAWYSEQLPDYFTSAYAIDPEVAAERALRELSLVAWSPELLTPPQRWGWEMIPIWAWRQEAAFATEWDDMPGALTAPEPPWSDPLVIDVSEWWARRQTRLLENEVQQMAGSFWRGLEALGAKLTASAARQGLGPQVLERLAFTVRREGMGTFAVSDTISECAHHMQSAL